MTTGSGQGGVRFKEPTESFFPEPTPLLGVPGTGLHDSDGTPEENDPSSLETCFRGEERKELEEMTEVEDEKFLSNASMDKS